VTSPPVVRPSYERRLTDLEVEVEDLHDRVDKVVEMMRKAKGRRSSRTDLAETVDEPSANAPPTVDPNAALARIDPDVQHIFEQVPELRRRRLL